MYYDQVITGLTIAVAFLIDTIEIFGLLSTELHTRHAGQPFPAGHYLE